MTDIPFLFSTTRALIFPKISWKNVWSIVLVTERSFHHHRPLLQVFRTQAFRIPKSIWIRAIKRPSRKHRLRRDFGKHDGIGSQSEESFRRLTMNCEVDMKIFRSLIARIIHVVTKKTDWRKMTWGIMQIKNCSLYKPRLNQNVLLVNFFLKCVHGIFKGR